MSRRHETAPRQETVPAPLEDESVIDVEGEETNQAPEQAPRTWGDRVRGLAARIDRFSSTADNLQESKDRKVEKAKKSAKMIGKGALVTVGVTAGASLAVGLSPFIATGFAAYGAYKGGKATYNAGNRAVDATARYTSEKISSGREAAGNFVANQGNLLTMATSGLSASILAKKRAVAKATRDFTAEQARRAQEVFANLDERLEAAKQRGATAKAQRDVRRGKNTTTNGENVQLNLFDY